MKQYVLLSRYSDNIAIGVKVVQLKEDLVGRYSIVFHHPKTYFWAIKADETSPFVLFFDADMLNENVEVIGEL